MKKYICRQIHGLMKYILTVLIGLSLSAGVFSQAERFISAAGEVNFSTASIVTENADEGGEVLRFAPWFNLQIYNNIDYKNHGYFMGFTIRNIGFIYENGNEKWKARTYNLGIPLGIK